MTRLVLWHWRITQIYAWSFTKPCSALPKLNALPMAAFCSPLIRSTERERARGQFSPFTLRTHAGLNGANDLRAAGARSANLITLGAAGGAVFCSTGEEVRSFVGETRRNVIPLLIKKLRLRVRLSDPFSINRARLSTVTISMSDQRLHERRAFCFV